MTAVAPEPVRVTPDADERVPDGVQVYDGPPHTDVWFAVRRDGITATDVPKIVGANDRATSLHVWLDKRGELPEDTGPTHFAEAGTRLEPVIAQWWADDHGVAVHKTGVWARRRPQDGGPTWMRCSPDRLLDHCPDTGETGVCGLEVKNRNAYVAGQWSDDVPDDVLGQGIWTMAVTGWSHLHVAALIGGNTPKWHRVARDAELEDYLISEAAAVWAAYLDGVPPAVDASAALSRLLDALHPDRDGGQIVDTDRAAEMYRVYAEGGDLERQGKALKARAREWAVASLEAAEELWVPGRAKPLVTYRAQEETAITADELRRLAREHPRIYARLKREGYVQTKARRTLRWAKKVGEEITGE